LYSSSNTIGVVHSTCIIIIVIIIIIIIIIIIGIYVKPALEYVNNKCS